MLTLATPRNMRAFEDAHPTRRVNTPDGPAYVEGPRAIAWSPTTGESYSASAGDYWSLPEDEPLRDSEGEPMLLVLRRTVHVDALTLQEV